MKQVILIISIFSFLHCSIHGQVVLEKKYYKDKYGIPANEKAAKVVELISKSQDSVVRHEWTYIKSKKLIKVECYKQNLPYGIWTYYSNGSPERTLDYSFDLLYFEKRYSNIINYQLNSVKADSVFIEGFTPPMFSTSEEKLHEFVAQNIFYPEYAKEFGIQGKVIVQFIITEEGTIENVSIYKGVEPHLDKEAARVIRSMPTWKPGKINSVPVKVSILFPIKFTIN
jgi:TonB family protein